MYSETQALPVCFGMDKSVDLQNNSARQSKTLQFVHLFDILHKITGNIPHDIAKVIVVQRPPLGHPKADILETRRVFRIGLERRNLAVLKLRQESFVRRPE